METRTAREATNARQAVRLGALSGGITDKRGDPSTPIFGAMAAASTALLLSLGSDLTFFQDEWTVISRANQWSFEAILEPFNEHPAAGLIIVYKVLLELFGMDSYVPFQLTTAALLATCAGLTMVLVRRRLGPVTGLIAAAILLTFGPAWEVLLWPISISFLGSVACGLGALAALDSERPRDWLVCLLTCVGLFFSGVGLVFAVAVALDVALRPAGARARDRLRRAWVVAVPAALVAAWYLAYGQEAESALSLDNVLAAPRYVADAAAAVLASLAGLVEVDAANSGALTGVDWGQPLLVAAVIAAALLAFRDPAAISRRAWMLAASALTFWGLTALNAIPGREPGASRYQLAGAVLVILLGSELLRGRRLRGQWRWVAGLAAAAVVVSNLGSLREGERFLGSTTDTARAELAALELAGERADRSLTLTPDVAGAPHLATIAAGPYLDAVASYGSPVPSGTLERATDTDRERADRVLATALGLTLEPAAAPAGECRHLPAEAELEFSPEPVVITSSGTTHLTARRFADVPTVALGTLRGPAVIRLAPDASDRPWVLRSDPRAARVCAASVPG